EARRLPIAHHPSPSPNLFHLRQPLSPIFINQEPRPPPSAHLPSPTTEKRTSTTSVHQPSKKTAALAHPCITADYAEGGDRRPYLPHTITDRYYFTAHDQPLACFTDHHQGRRSLLENGVLSIGLWPTLGPQTGGTRK
ncbi:hypothetical protein Dimus_003370, partial [Dionaea muscipula]